MARANRLVIRHATDRGMCPKGGMMMGSVALARLIAFLLRRPHCHGAPVQGRRHPACTRGSGVRQSRFRGSIGLHQPCRI